MFRKKKCFLWCQVASLAFWQFLGHSTEVFVTKQAGELPTEGAAGGPTLAWSPASPHSSAAVGEGGWLPVPKEPKHWKPGKHCQTSLFSEAPPLSRTVFH